MRIRGCDLHARQQTLAMLDTLTGEAVNRTLLHEGNQVREFYSELPRPVLVGMVRRDRRDEEANTPGKNSCHGRPR